MKGADAFDMLNQVQQIPVILFVVFAVIVTFTLTST